MYESYNHKGDENESESDKNIKEDKEKGLYRSKHTWCFWLLAFNFFYAFFKPVADPLIPKMHWNSILYNFLIVGFYIDIK